MRIALIAALATTPLFAVPGEVIDTGTYPGLILSDLAPAPDGTLWAVGRTDGKVYHLSGELELIPADTLSHPFGPASPLPPFQPVCRGVAVIPQSNSLAILNSSTSQIQQLSLADGTPLGDPVTLQAPAGSLLTSLSYDADRGVLWCVDSEGDRVLAFDPQSGELKKTFGFPGDGPPETYLYGTGVAYGISDTTPVLYLLWGDIFQEDARTVKLLSPETGDPDPFTLDLNAVGAGQVRSVAYLNGTLALLLWEEGASTVVTIDATRPTPLPPSDLTCQAQENGDVQLTWVNNGLGFENAYTEISIMRDGAAVAQLPGSATSFLDQTAPGGVLHYEIRARWGMEQLRPVHCELRNRRGALLSWRPFPGGSVSGIAIDPETGDVWVTDAKPVEPGKYLLWHLTPDLEVVETHEVSAPGPLYGITFWPDADLGSGPETIILVANEGTNTVSRLRRDGSLAGGAVPLRLPAETDSPDPKVGALAYDAANGNHFLAVLDTALHRIVWVDRYGFPPDPDDPDQAICVPPGTSGIVPSNGLAVSPETGFLQIGIENGSIHEVNRYCNVTPFDINPAIPDGPLSSIRIKDFAYSGHIMYVTSPATNSIFKILAYPTGKPFVRGETNGDGKVDIGDVVFCLQYLFEAGLAPACLDAADANDDGRIDISDPVYLLFFLFDEGPPPPPPYPEAGLDPTLADDFSC